MSQAAIISLYYKNFNFGGQLQSFALQRKIEKLNIECEQICINRKQQSELLSIIEIIKHSDFKEIVSRVIGRILRYCSYVVLFRDRAAIMKRDKKTFDFSLTVPHTSTVYDEDTIKKIANDYSTFIVGSDCVWYINESSELTGLSFVGENRHKISYAASLGCAAIPDGWAEKYIKNIAKFDAIAVREKSIAAELQELIPQKKVNVTVDPVLLFNASEWNEFLPDVNIKEKYALIYILSEDRKQCLEAQKWARDNGMKAVVFPHIRRRIVYWQKNFGDIRDFSSGPLEFVSLIKNADVILTDSFHASVFSVIFHKPFFAFMRETEKGFVGRVENFLEEIGLSKQLISVDNLANIKSIPEIDFSFSDSIIEQKRRESINYLKENIV